MSLPNQFSSSYIEVFHNDSGDITLAVSDTGLTDLQVVPIQTICIKHKDAKYIAGALIKLAREVE